MLLPRLFVDVVNVLLIYSVDYAVSLTTGVAGVVAAGVVADGQMDAPGPEWSNFSPARRPPDSALDR